MSPAVDPSDIATIIEIAKTLEDLFNASKGSSSDQAFAEIEARLAEIESKVDSIIDMLKQLDEKIDEKFDQEQNDKVISIIGNIGDNFELWKSDLQKYQGDASKAFNDLHTECINLTLEHRSYSHFNTAALAMIYEDRIMRLLALNSTTRAKHIDKYVQYFDFIASKESPRTFASLRDAASTISSQLKEKHDVYLLNPVDVNGEKQGTALLLPYKSQNFNGISWTGYNFAHGTLIHGYDESHPADVIWSDPMPLPAPGTFSSPTYQVNVPTHLGLNVLNSEVTQYRYAGYALNAYNVALAKIAGYSDEARKLRNAK